MKYYKILNFFGIFFESLVSGMDPDPELDMDPYFKITDPVPDTGG
jgi:hypothetical protein